MYVAVTGPAQITVEGSNYTALVPVTAYDDPGENTPIGSTNLTITGPLTDTIAQIKTKGVAAVAAWKVNIQAVNTMAQKFAQIIGAQV